MKDTLLSQEDLKLDGIISTKMAVSCDSFVTDLSPTQYTFLPVTDTDGTCFLEGFPQKNHHRPPNPE